MDTELFITKATIWIALFGYFLATGIWASRRSVSVDPGFAAYRLVWSLAMVAYLGHVLAAFAFHHSWSHVDAYAATARQTAEVMGLNWGGGVWFNYLFTLIWLVEVIWMWVRPVIWINRPGWITGWWQGFFIFMVFNATVVFEDGPVRWFGLLGCGWIAVRWGRRKKA